VVGVNFGEEKYGGTCAWNYELHRTWTATDNCGNEDTYTQTVIVSDSNNPTWSGAIYSDFTVEQEEAYGGDWEAPDAYAVTCDDDCGVPTISFTQTITSDDDECESEVKQIRNWACVDVCGNRIDKSQTIRIVDTTPPTICEPEHATVECDSIPEAVEFSETSEGDPVTFSQVEVEYLGGPVLDPARKNRDCFWILRTWSAADCSGNKIEYTQTIQVEDTFAPVFTQLPEDVTAGCDCDEFNFPIDMDVVDNCDYEAGDNVKFEEIRTDGTCGQSYELDRIWTVTDSCGNPNELTQRVTVVDEDPPSFCECPDEFVTYECDFVPEAMNVTARDACDPEPEFELYQQTEDGTCEGYYKIYRAWVAVDDCGNEHSCYQTVTVVDEEPPIVLDPFEFCLSAHSDAAYANKRLAVFENPEEMTAIVDNCGEVDLRLIACNSTQDPVYDNPMGLVDKFNPDCYLQKLGPKDNALYVHMQTADDEDRVYTLFMEATDECGSVSVVEQKFWVAHSARSYRQKIDLGGCPHGVGAVLYQNATPTIF
jgi:hypothetical protein